MLLKVLFLVINLLSGFIGYLTATGNLHDDRRIWYKRPKPKGWLCLGLILSLVVLVLVHYSVSDQLQAERDLVANDKAEENKNRIISTIVDKLAEYHLEYDSSQQRIINVLQDSLEQSITIIEAPTEPDVNVCSSNGLRWEKISSDSGRIVVRVCVVNAPAHNVDLKVQWIAKYKGGQHNLSPKFTPIVKRRISIGAVLEFSIELVRDEPPEIIFVWLTGLYFDASQKHRYSVDELFMYNIKDEQFGLPYDSPHDSTLTDLKKFLGV